MQVGAFYKNCWETGSPDYAAEYVRRTQNVSKLTDRQYRLAVMAYYKHDPVAWIEDFVFTYNPRNVHPLPKTMPFMLFPRQVDFINFILSCYRDKESGLVEKSRDMGATWICVAMSVWFWLFEDGASIGWGSRKEMLVDRLGDPDSIFEKIRMIIRSLPKWMLPPKFNWGQHCNYMKIINPDNGSTIKGEAGDNIGRGGRSSIYFKDESAHYERPDLIEAALGDNTDTQIDISSVNGTGNVFYRRRMAGQVWEPNSDLIPRGITRIFIMDWRHHPLKTQDWYDNRRQKAERDGLTHVFAQEVDRDYTSAVDRIIIPQKWVKAAIDAHKKLGFDSSGERIAALDVADEGGDKNGYAGRHGVILKAAMEWGEGDAGESARQALSLSQLHGFNEFYYDSIGVGAAVKAETNRLKQLPDFPRSLLIMPWNAAAAVLEPEDHLIRDDPNSPKNDDFFTNLKAQAWWSLRMRFEKTYKAITQGAVYPFEELISIPSELENLHLVCAQLSQAQQRHGMAGKLLVDKKPEGTRSPNLADAIVMCYYPTREVSILDVL